MQAQAKNLKENEKGKQSYAHKKRLKKNKETKQEDRKQKKEIFF